jgi:hypothetical protein
MVEDGRANSGARARHSLSSIPGRAAVATLRPFTNVAVPELERLVGAALDTPELQRAARRAFESDAARQLIDSFFDSGLFDHFVDRMLADGALWRIVDEVAASPTVTAAIAQQGLGFGEQIGDELRSRSRSADDWLERLARRLLRRRENEAADDVPESTGDAS